MDGFSELNKNWKFIKIILKKTSFYGYILCLTSDFWLSLLDKNIPKAVSEM